MICVEGLEIDLLSSTNPYSAESNYREYFQEDIVSQFLVESHNNGNVN
jgi:hypothetical protein